LLDVQHSSHLVYSMEDKDCKYFHFMKLPLQMGNKAGCSNMHTNSYKGAYRMEC
jgi:hypothetical protein